MFYAACTQVLYMNRVVKSFVLIFDAQKPPNIFAKGCKSAVFNFAPNIYLPFLLLYREGWGGRAQRRGPPWLVTADTPCTAGRGGRARRRGPPWLVTAGRLVQVGPPPSVRQFGALGSWRSPIWRAGTPGVRQFGALGGVRPLAFANLARWVWLVTAADSC